MFLRPSVKTYGWGKRGKNSLVAQLTGEDEDTPYAELWMGIHPSGPCQLLSESHDPSLSLAQYLETHPESLGNHTLSKFGKLPFLFKILSVETALSIQAHPDKTLAKSLHLKDPVNYPDDNHKPEMAIALSSFEVLCGFRSLENIQVLIQSVPELKSIVGDINVKTKEDLKSAFELLMKADHLKVVEAVRSIIDRGNEIPEYDLIRRINQQYPGDIGILSVYFLQHFTLQPEEAIYLPANEPHAYIYGDCLECMANSDNVVRAGLTPKFKDVNVLLDMLTFESGNDWKIKASPGSHPGCLVYKPPFQEFAVELWETSNDFELNVSQSCSICILLDGKCRVGDIAMSRGTVIFLPGGDFKYKFHIEDKVKMGRAFCPI